MTAKRKLDIDASRERMTTLGLMYAADQEPLLSDAVKNGTAPHAFVDQLLEAEYLARRSPRPCRPAPVQPCRPGSRSPTSTSPSSRRSSALAHRHAGHLRLHPRRRDGADPGTTGVGKSHLAVGLGVKAVEHGFGQFSIASTN